MSNAMLVGVYQPGSSLVHRTPVGVKVLALAAFSLAIVLVRSMPASVAFLAVALAAAVVARLPLRLLLRTDIVIVGMVTIGVVGLILDRTIQFIGRRAMPWSRSFSA